MNKLLKILLIYLIMTASVGILSNQFNVNFGKTDFWDSHGIFFLISITIFPRLTLLISDIAFGGLFWWLGFIFSPRFLVACLSYLSYWESNPILVTIAWLICLGGESGEKYMVAKKVKTRQASAGKVFEAEFTRKE